MKKRFLSLALALLMLLSLTACGECKHEWTDTTCTSPSTCTKCGETQGEPYGHSWTEASCSAPETCSICGETQGEALPHSYGTWSIGENDMSRSCTVCGETETTELDYEQAFMTLLPGRWDFFICSSPQGSLQTYSGVPDLYMDVDEDGICSMFLPGYGSSELESVEEFTFLAQFSEYSMDEELYLFYLVDGSGEALRATLGYMAGTLSVIIHFDDDINYMLTKNPDETAALAGTWVCASDGELCRLDLSEDGTFTGNVNGEISGTWHSMPAILNNGTWYFGFNLIYEQDGIYGFTGNIIWLAYEDMDYKEAMKNNSSSVSLRFNDEFYSFSPVSEEELKEMENAMEVGVEKILGTWSCSSVEIYDYNNSTEEAGDFSITFNEDGSYTAEFFVPMEGSWSFRGPDLNGNEIDCLYDITADGNDTYIRLSDRNGLMFSYNASDGNHYTYHLNKN